MGFDTATCMYMSRGGPPRDKSESEKSCCSPVNFCSDLMSPSPSHPHHALLSSCSSWSFVCTALSCKESPRWAFGFTKDGANISGICPLTIFRRFLEALSASAAVLTAVWNEAGRSDCAAERMAKKSDCPTPPATDSKRAPSRHSYFSIWPGVNVFAACTSDFFGGLWNGKGVRGCRIFMWGWVSPILSKSPSLPAGLAAVRRSEW